MEYLMTGYQYNPADGHYIGSYEFPCNRDQYDVHLPPNTTLKAPPTAIPPGMWAVFQDDDWVVVEDNDPDTAIPFPDVPFAALLPAYIADLKRAGQYEQLLAFYQSRPDLTAQPDLPEKDSAHGH